MKSAREIFRAEYGNSMNFMTPYPVEYGKKYGKFYEISSGEGFQRQPIFGVTVLSYDLVTGIKREHDLSKCFQSLEEAKDYIKRGFNN